jgi:molybdopterin-containing oxidoreductase family membrane subunit
MKISPRTPDQRLTGSDDPVIAGKHDYKTITDIVGDIPLEKGFRKGWLFGFSIAFGLLMLFMFGAYWLFANYIGVWGINVPVAWGFAIVTFVWWIGIGHAGTLISAILLLFRQDWRNSINRFAEAMTLFAVACAGLFPILHLGRPEFFYWLLPHPSTLNVYPQFRSALIWDVFAISTYASVSLLFWYVGLIPDAASMRDKARSYAGKLFYGMLALGWRGSARHWHRYMKVYWILACLATPLVVSVHTVVSFDFAIGVVPGWHATIFPPFFVAGAIFSGFAMVLTLMIPVRAVYGLKDFVTDRHLDNMAKITLVSGLIVVHGYVTEAFFAWYSGEIPERAMMMDRMFGHYGWSYWLLLTCNAATVQLLWFPKIRRNPVILFLISLVINVGMWLERFIIVVQSLSHDFLPSSWDTYTPTRWDFAVLIGSVGLFLTLLFVFMRLIPMINIFEMKEIMHHKLKHDHASKEGAA